MKKLFSSQKFLVRLTTAISLLAVFVTGVSTFAWFQVNQKPENFNLVTGSSNATVDRITGYKINETYKNNGYINYDNNNVTAVDADTSAYSTRTNLDKEGADVNFDVPSTGIGYYLVKPSADGSYKFSSATYSKFTEYNTGNMSFVESVYFASVGSMFRIRSYQMDGSQTALTNISVASVTYNGVVNNSCLSNGDVVIPAIGTYKVWFNTSNHKVGLEFLNSSNLLQAQALKGRANLHGTDTFYFNSNGMYNQGSELTFCYLFGSGGNNGWPGVQMTYVTGNIFSISVDTTVYQTAIFCRVSKDGNKTVWNQTVDVTIPTDIYGGNNCWKVTTWNGSGTKETGSFETYSSRSYTVTMSYNSGAYAAMTLKSGTEYYYNIASATTGASLAFKINGEAITVSKKSGSDGFNQNNTSDGTQISYGNSRPVTVFLDISNQKVWVSTVFELNVGSTKYPMSQVMSGDVGEYNPSFRQYKATYSGTANQSVTVLVNGTSTAYNRDGDTYNNLNDSKKIAKTVSNMSGYLKFGDSDASPTMTTAKSTLWLDGNKVYEIYPDSTATGTHYPMVYNSGGTYDGWYKYESLSVTGGKTIRIDINGEDITSTVSQYTSGDNNSIKSDKKWYDSGIVDIYFNTSTKKVYATPIYKITIGSTTKQAFLAETNIYRTSTNFTMTDGQAISVKRNGSAYAVTRQADDSLANRNNIRTDGLYVMYDATDTAEINVSTSKIWVDGYAPTYYYKLNSGSWNAMTYNSGTSTSKVTATIPSGTTQGTTITFRKSASNTSYNTSVSADSTTAFNNLNGSAGSLTVASTLTSSATLTLDFDNNRAYLTGRTMTFYWYNNNHSLADNQQFKYYLFNSSTKSALSSWPGTNMTVDSNDSRLQSFTFTVSAAGYDSVIFNDGDASGSTVSTAHQTMDIDLTSVTPGYVCRISQADNGFAGTADAGDSNRKKWTVDWFANPPSNDEDYTFYIQNNNNYFNGTINGFAWDTTGSYMDKGGAFFPGTAADVIVDGELYRYSVADEYNKMLFANSSGNRQTADITSISTYDGGVWIATGYSSNVTGSWATTKTTSVGSATIYISSDEGETWSEEATMYDGDLSSNDYMYELGIQATHGDYLKVVTNYSGESATEYKDSSNFIVDEYTRPYLKVTEDYIQVKLDSDTATARFNFYITHSPRKLAIVMVPDLGNGFYIVPYTHSTTEGFIGAKKMNSSSDTSAVYTGYLAEANDKVYLRSYLNAVDTYYSTVNLSAFSNSEVTASDGVITFNDPGYYNIEVSGTTIIVTPFVFNDFFTVNRLDINNAANANAIKGQKTSLVLEVELTTLDNNFPMEISLGVSNSANTYVGVAFYCSDTALDNPYVDMRTSYYSFSTGSVVSNANTSFTTTPGTTKYYAYIMIDYVYSNSLASMAVKPTGALTFEIITTQVTS